MVHVVQLVRASDCGSECRGFESHLAPFKRSQPRVASFFCTPSFLFLYSPGPLFKARLRLIKVAQTSASTLLVCRKIERLPMARRNESSADRRLMLLLVFRALSSP